MAEPETNTPKPDIGPVGNADRFCRSCLYCLGDLTDPDAPSVCPECGQAFVKADPRSTLLQPRRRKPMLLRWPVLLIVGALTIVAMAQMRLLPSPIAGGGGALWEWRYHKYGYQDGLWWWVGDAYGTRTLVRDELSITMTLHAGIASKVVAIDPIDDHHVFTIERKGNPPVWSLRIDDHDLAWPADGARELIRAINLTREHRFGVTIYTPPDTPRLTPTGPTIASGTEADIFWAYVNAYGLVIDFPELVPRSTDGWHPTLEPGQRVDYPPADDPTRSRQPRGFFRGR